MKRFITLAILLVAWLVSAVPAAAQAPTLTRIDPPGRTDLTSNSVAVTLTGSGFTNEATLGFDPPGVITASGWTQTGGVSATVTFTLSNSNTTVSMVDIWVQTANGPSQKLPFSTGVLTNICLEALQTGGCQLRWEIDATGVTGSSNESNNSTTPNILVTLDYQWHSPKNRIQKQVLRARGFTSENDSWTDHVSVHATVKSGYTQVVAANNVQLTPNSGGGSSKCLSNCTIAVPQQAFVAELGGRLSWASGVDGAGTFGEFGVGAHGSFEYLVPKNQIVQNGGATYIDLSAANPNNVVGFYEATGHFRLGQLGHDKTLPNAATGNGSSLLVIEGGYQNNRALQGLIAGSSTRNRYVGRFYLNPEISSTNHTKITLGMEYSGGINGGPHVVQIFFGTNLNPAKLFGKAVSQQ